MVVKSFTKPHTRPESADGTDRQASHGDELERLAGVARALGHPERLRIVFELADGKPRTAGELAGGSSLAQSTVSAHLRALRNGHILRARSDGPRIWYSLRPDALAGFALEIERVSLPAAGGPRQL